MKAFPHPLRARLAALILAAALVLPGCAPGSAPAPQTLTVLAAASLTGAFTDLGAQFEAEHPGVKVQFNFAGSQQLAQQLGQGAAADVFASANPKQMDAVVQAGRVGKDVPRTFAQNRLVVVVPKSNPGRVAGLADLARGGLKIVLATKEVPVGQYSLDFLDKAVQDSRYGAGFKDQVLANVVSYEENVKSVLVKIALGEADAGIVYTSDVSGADAERVTQIPIPDALNVIATYPIAVIQDSARPELAQQFTAFVLSAEGQAQLQKYGFLPAR